MKSQITINVKYNYYLFNLICNWKICFPFLKKKWKLWVFCQRIFFLKYSCDIASQNTYYSNSTDNQCDSSIVINDPNKNSDKNGDFFNTLIFKNDYIMTCRWPWLHDWDRIASRESRGNCKITAISIRHDNHFPHHMTAI